VKFVYILVGSTDGFYYEHTLFSLASLKNVCPFAKITLLVDDLTSSAENALFSQIRDYVDEYIVHTFEKEVPSIAKSRILKTKMRSLIEGDFLYVDSDTVWAAPIDESVFLEDVMGVLDGNCNLNDHPLRMGILKDFEKTGCNPCVEKYVNGGVLYVKDSMKSRKFFDIWHNKWLETSKSGYYIDMPSLNYAFKEVYENDVPLLPGTYNAQISRSWKFFPGAKLIHFFTGWMSGNDESPYCLQTKKFWNSVRENGLNGLAMRVLKNPYEAFDVPIKICDKNELEMQKTTFYGLIWDMYKRKVNGEMSKFDLLEKMIKFFLFYNRKDR